MNGRHAVHALCAALAAAWLLLVVAPPAAAHGGAAEEASDFRSFFIDGAAACLQWDVLASDGFLELRSTCPGTVTVLGYEDEPYLEFTAAGVRENQNSPAAYLNRDPNANVAVPDRARADAPPDWAPRSSLPTYRWHDHRTHWMSSAAPQTGRDSGSVRVSQWAIPVELDDDGAGTFRYRLEARGELWYHPPLPWWIPIGLAVLPVGVALGLALLRRDEPDDPASDDPEPGGPGGPRAVRVAGLRSPALARPVAALLGLVIVLTVISAVDDVARGGQSAGQRITTGAIAAAVVAAGAWAAWRARRGDDTSFLALVGAALAIGWAFGMQHRPSLTASQLRTALPDVLVRLTVGLQLLIIVPAVIVLLVWRGRIHRLGRPTGRPVDGAPGADAPSERIGQAGPAGTTDASGTADASGTTDASGRRAAGPP
jgi:hypothetical protein